jgi:glycosyltransferase involved in cell wall biosynthesis
MKVLVLVKDYPRLDGKIELMYVHVRNKYYKQNNIEVTVLNFASDIDYEIDGIKVITLKTFKTSNEIYNLLIAHAANIRNHYLFLINFRKQFRKQVFFFHGHEVLKLNAEYPAPFSFIVQKRKIRLLFQDIYDELKFLLWRHYFTNNVNDIRFIFVSNWIFNKFKHYLKIKSSKVISNSVIINNAVGEDFEFNSYNWKSSKIYDFITIRSNLDGSKYGVDIVVELAKQNPQLLFLIIGKGNYFEHYELPKNVTWINRSLQHIEMLQLMDSAKCGLLPTREDTQGVMTCEMATYGMPVITSDIDVCKEIFYKFKNVKLISNNNLNINLKDILENLYSGIPYKKCERYLRNSTMLKEVQLIKDFCREG